MKRFFYISFLQIFLSLVLALPASASVNALLYLSPLDQAFSVGKEFVVDVMMNTAGEKVNAIQVYISYPTKMADLMEVNTDSSALKFFVEKKTEGGTLKISGGLPTPGIMGVQKIASIKFKAKVPGVIKMSFTKESVILTDAENKDILDLKSSLSGTFKLVSGVPPTPTPWASPSPDLSAKPTRSPPSQALQSSSSSPWGWIGGIAVIAGTIVGIVIYKKREASQNE